MLNNINKLNNFKRRINLKIWSSLTLHFRRRVWLNLKVKYASIQA